MIYFVQAESGPIKIGYTSALNMTFRFSVLQCNNHEKLKILKLFSKGTWQDERKIHKKLKKSHLRGEWFLPTYEVFDLIEKGESIYTSEVINNSIDSQILQEIGLF